MCRNDMTCNCILPKLSSSFKQWMTSHENKREYLISVIEFQQRKMTRLTRKANNMICSLDPKHYRMTRSGHYILWDFEFKEA